MARYDWDKLKKEFILGEYESVREFAAQKGIKYNGYFAAKTRGWTDEKRALQEQKQSKIIERVIEKQIEQEVNWNITHLNLWGEFLNILRQALENPKNLMTKDGRISAYILEKFANVMEKIQKGQRLALGLDEQQQAAQDELITRLQEIVGALNDDCIQH
ncbi:hypothetical protein KVG29_08785 [Caldicoprobacter algeriensis]|uniref:hypothetical protein n=1 Tax=Caldicoprobacter algeriensis TaxID=699281 RepID=UPI002079F599|nr:hypothetical protein [Caldicoprobacter algeriensis]MCM8901314.1 hypothetical protein [Caldicoprobacter algeriensis]